MIRLPWDASPAPIDARYQRVDHRTNLLFVALMLAVCGLGITGLVTVARLVGGWLEWL